MNDYRTSGPDSQGLHTIHAPDGQAVRFRGGMLQFADKDVARDFAKMLSMARVVRDDDEKKGFWEKELKGVAP